MISEGDAAAAASIDLNADLGEGCGNDEALLAFVTSANVACGLHAGDRESMTATVRAAFERGVRIGAHPSYPDRAGFGRTAMVRSPKEIFDDVTGQVRALIAIADSLGARVEHVKAHGALYNAAASDEAVARALAAAIRDVDPALALVGLAGSLVLRVGADFGLTAIAEGFVDRRYAPSGELVPRSSPGATIEDPVEAAEQAVSIARDGRVRAIDGSWVSVRARSICLHGDGPHALAFARSVVRRLRESGVEIRASA